jgi:C-terminal processing protease CtpA/Prc
MMKRLLLLALLLSVVPIAAQDAPPPADIENDEGGPVRIVGSGSYSFFGIPLIYDEPVILLEGLAGIVDRDLQFVIPLSDQIIGRLTSDFFTSPFTYEIDLPAAPQGSRRDVDFDGEDDPGVQIYTVSAAQNFINDSYIERVEQGNAIITSVKTQLIFPEVTGGTILVYAPDDAQGFPAGFGEDGRMFTEDDPIVTLPQGYTIVHIEADGFRFDRSREGVIDSEEIDLAENIDFSDQTYIESFNSLIDLLIERYSYTEYRSLDWEALRAEFVSQVEAIEGDAAEYYFILVELVHRIGDAHVSADIDPEAIDDQTLSRLFLNYLLPIGGTLGVSITETDDGKIVVQEVAPDSPAVDAGITFGTEIVAVNGTPIEEKIANALLWPNFPGTDETRRIAQIGASLLFPAGESITLTYLDTDGNETTVDIRSGSYDILMGFDALLANVPSAEMAVSYELLESGYGYVTVPSFTRTNASLAIWEDMVRQLNEFAIPGLVIDMRGNGGGSGGMQTIMTSYFFSEEAPYVDDSVIYVYDFQNDGIVKAPDFNAPLYAPSPEEVYSGEVVILIDEMCASACEFFSYGLQNAGRATVVGQYASAGAGGSVNQLSLPDGIVLNYTYTRVLTPDESQPIIEGIGVIPDVEVPVTLETLTAVANGEDPVLQAGIDVLND